MRHAANALLQKTKNAREFGMLMHQRGWAATCAAIVCFSLGDAAVAQFTCEVDVVVADPQGVDPWSSRSVSIATARAAVGHAARECRAAL